MRPSRRTVLSLAAAAVAGAIPGMAALRVPSGGVLRVPLPAPRRVLEPARAVDVADVWPMGLIHEPVATVNPEGTVVYPLLVAPPSVDRGDPRTVTVSLRPGLVWASGATVDARAVVAAWVASRRSSPLAEMVAAMCDSAVPFEVRGERDIRVRLAVPGLADDVLTAWPLAVTGPRGAGLGAFRPHGTDASTVERNPHCPTGGAYLERVELTPARERNEELRGFVTGTLDASWRGHALYDVDRAAQGVRGPPAGVVGLVPTRGGPLDDPAHARAVERALSALATGTDALLGPVGVTAPPPGDVGRLAAEVPRIRVAREPGDGLLAAVAERVVALLDAVHIQVALVGPTEPAEAVLRAVAPVGGDAPLAVAGFLAVAGDPAGASAAARTPRAGRGAVVTGVWARGAAAVLGRVVPSLHLRPDVRDARFDATGRLLLSDAWMARGHR